MRFCTGSAVGRPSCFSPSGGVDGPGYWGAGALSASALSADTARPARRWRSAGGYAAGGYAALSGAVCLVTWRIHPALGFAVQVLWSWQALAVRGLAQESRRVYEQLRRGDLAAARRAVGRIVGRDTERLDEAGATRGRRGNSGGKFRRRCGGSADVSAPRRRARWRCAIKQSTLWTAWWATKTNAILILAGPQPGWTTQRIICHPGWRRCCGLPQPV